MIGLGIAVAPGALRRGIGVTAPVTAPVTAAVLPVSPAARWHAGVSAVTVAGGRVTLAPDLAGLVPATEGAAGQGPLAHTDPLGRRCWRFLGSEFLDIGTGLSGQSRSFALFLVCRVHVGGYMDIASLGSARAGTAGGAGNLVLDQNPNGRAPVLRAVGRAATVDPAAWKYMIAGSQLQVIGVNCRATGNGGTVLMLDGRKTASLGQSSVAGSFAGAEIGRNSALPGPAGTNGSWAKMDLYEAVAFAGHLSDPDADAVQAALMAAWGISSRVDQLVVEGDSISSYSAEGDFGDTEAMILTEPGQGPLQDWRVFTVATPGNTIADLLARRDQANGWAAAMLPGRNAMVFEIGRNTLGTTTGAAAHRASLVAYLDTAATGVLPRGWTVRQLANIATTSDACQTEIVAQRAILRDPAYLTDTRSGAGQANAGRLTVIGTDLVTAGGDPVFADSADAADPAWYHDGTHPTPAGQRLRVLGGDDPAAAIAYGL